VSTVCEGDSRRPPRSVLNNPDSPHQLPCSGLLSRLNQRPCNSQRIATSFRQPNSLFELGHLPHAFEFDPCRYRRGHHQENRIEKRPATKPGIISIICTAGRRRSAHARPPAGRTTITRARRAGLFSIPVCRMVRTPISISRNTQFCPECSTIESSGTFPLNRRQNGSISSP
jgi:hypothetical protein